MTAEIPDSHLRRLVLAKMLFVHGVYHARLKDQTSRMLSIHHFDNAGEVVLRLLADISGERYEENNFNSILAAATRAYKRDAHKPAIPEQNEIVELHKVRNRIQHAAVVVDPSTVERFKQVCENFMSGVIQTLFGKTLTQVSLGGLIDDPQLRALVQRAETHLEAKQFRECLTESHDALMMALAKGVTYKAGYLAAYWGVGFGAEILDQMLDSEKYASRYTGQTKELAGELAKALHGLGKGTTTMQFMDVYRAEVVHHLKRVNKLDQLSPAELADGAVLSLDLVTNLILRWEAENVLIT